MVSRTSIAGQNYRIVGTPGRTRIPNLLIRSSRRTVHGHSQTFIEANWRQRLVRLCVQLSVVDCSLWLHTRLHLSARRIDFDLELGLTTVSRGNRLPSQLINFHPSRAATRPALQLDDSADYTTPINAVVFRQNLFDAIHRKKLPQIGDPVTQSLRVIVVKELRRVMLHADLFKLDDERRLWILYVQAAETPARRLNEGCRHTSAIEGRTGPTTPRDIGCRHV